MEKSENSDTQKDPKPTVSLELGKKIKLYTKKQKLVYADSYKRTRTGILLFGHMYELRGTRGMEIEKIIFQNRLYLIPYNNIDFILFETTEGMEDATPQFDTREAPGG